MSAPSDARAVEALGRDLSRLIGDGTLPPEAEEALRSLIALAERLASDNARMAVTIAAQEGRIAELAAQVAALTAQIVQLQRDLYGSRSERRREGEDGSDDDRGADGKDRRRGGRPGRKKERGDAVNDTGLRFNENAPVIDIAVTPPEIEGLSEDDYEVVSERVHCRLAALEWRHVVIRYRHLTVKIRETGALAGAPAREGVFKNSCADVSFVAALLIDKFLWHLPLHRQHRMLAAAGITVNRGSLSLWANWAIALLKPIHDAQWRSVLESAGWCRSPRPPPGCAPPSRPRHRPRRRSPAGRRARQGPYQLDAVGPRQGESHARPAADARALGPDAAAIRLHSPLQMNSPRPEPPRAPEPAWRRNKCGRRSGGCPRPGEQPVMASRSNGATLPPALESHGDETSGRRTRTISAKRTRRALSIGTEKFSFVGIERFPLGAWHRPPRIGGRRRPGTEGGRSPTGVPGRRLEKFFPGRRRRTEAVPVVAGDHDPSLFPAPIGAGLEQVLVIPHPVGVPADVDDVAAVDQAVDESRRHHLVAEHAAPLLEALVRRQHGRGAFVPGVDELEEEHGAVLADRQVADLVDHEERRVGEHAQPVRQVAGGLRFGERVDQPGQGAVIDAPAGLRRGDREAYGQVRFADAWRNSHILPDTRAAVRRFTIPFTPARASACR